MLAVVDVVLLVKLEVTTPRPLPHEIHLSLTEQTMQIRLCSGRLTKGLHMHTIFRPLARLIDALIYLNTENAFVATDHA